MNELEQQLKTQRLAAPSTALDQRISDAFAAVARSRQSSRNRQIIWWWFSAFAACGATAALFLSGTLWRHPTPKQITYRIEAQGRLRLLLLEPPASANRVPRFVVTTHAP